MGHGPRVDRIRPHFWTLFPPKKTRFHCQVNIFFGWVTWVLRHVLHGQNPVLVNIDETALQKGMPQRKGYHLFKLNLKKSQIRAVIRHRDTRSHVTYLACTTNVSDLQAHLPQFILPNHERLRPSEREALENLVAPMQWIRNGNGWLKSEDLTTCISQIRRVVRTHCPNRELVLLMDAAPTHFAQGVVSHCSKLNVLVVFFPAKLTYLLQPLDSHVFGVLKHTLSLEHLHMRQASPSGSMSSEDWVGAANKVIRSVIVNRNWTASFARNGLPPDAGIIRDRIVAVGGSNGPWDCKPPSSSDLEILMNVKVRGLRERLMRYPTRILDRPPPIVPPVRRRLPRLVRLPPAPLPPPIDPHPDDEGSGAHGAGEGAGAVSSSASGPRRTRSGALY